ncbi:MAG: proline racemase family protein [Candidatus Aminicenantales bacterium]
MSRRAHLKPDWNFPPGWTVIKTIDVHAAGEPLRVVTAGLPPIPGKSMLAKRQYAKKNLDHLRTALLWEPRGHADMYGCIPTGPVSPGSHLGILFLHNEGFSTMCGHGIIAFVTAAIETGMIAWQEDEPVLRIDTPAGLVTARAKVENGRVSEVSFLNVPSFVYILDKAVDVPGFGQVKVDIAFGGAFYAFCSAQSLGLGLVPEEFRSLIDLGMKVKRAVEGSIPIRHPLEPDLGFLYGTIFVGEPQVKTRHSRHVCIFAEGEVDRSPTGTGVSGRAALLSARGELERGRPFVVESIIGTCFRGCIEARTRLGPYDAVIPEVTGSAFLTGRNEFLINPSDPLRHGFILR